MPGNQEPKTPHVNESERWRSNARGAPSGDGGKTAHASDGHRARVTEKKGQAEHHPEWGKAPGNQDPNTPDVRESDRRRR